MRQAVRSLMEFARDFKAMTCKSPGLLVCGVSFGQSVYSYARGVGAINGGMMEVGSIATSAGDQDEAAVLANPSKTCGTSQDN